MIKIGISGKANSGKNTLAKLLIKEIKKQFSNTRYMKNKVLSYQFLAFADPIKDMAQIAFPTIPKKWLYGPSELRNMIVPDAIKNKHTVSVRQVLMDLGNDFGRAYNPNIWIDNFDYRLKIANKKRDVIIATDCRFRLEFDYLKFNRFFQIRILRDQNDTINDVSETDQNNISDSEFNFVIDNSKTKKHLQNQVIDAVNRIKGFLILR